MQFELLRHRGMLSETQSECFYRLRQFLKKLRSSSGTRENFTVARGGLLGVARVNAAKVPTATRLEQFALTLITIVRPRRCFAGRSGCIPTRRGSDCAPSTLRVR